MHGTAAMQDVLGIQPKNMAEGCLQDVHWFVGKFGYFPAYTVGHMLAAQQFEAMNKDVPDLPNAIAEGRFTPVNDWLRTKIHANGRLHDYKTVDPAGDRSGHRPGCVNPSSGKTLR